MITVKILKPLWKNGGSVGIDERKFNKEGVLVEIDYKDKYGQKIYPHTYKKAENAETMLWKKNNSQSNTN